MGFYKDKKMAYAMISDLFSKGKTEREIIYAIQNEFGFSKKFVVERLQLLNDLLYQKEQEEARKEAEKDVFRSSGNN